MTSLAERAAQLSPNARAALARELVRAGTTFPTDICEPVAVVGIGCRFPGNVTGPESFWQLLADGVDTIEQVPPDRWDADAFYDPDPSASGRMTTKWGGFVSDVDAFDADFFGITPREAVAMDPQHRMLLEVAWEALEHAGIPPDSLSGTRTGVMMGLSSWDYTIVNIERRADIDAYLSTGTPHCAAVGRIAYLLGLRGPAVAVDTACSSSLVAIHLACQSLRLRETDVALAGGVQLTLSPFTAIALSKWSALSPTGRCNSFDANADGFVRGEGCGVVVLKRLADAVRDQDRVLAVVRGSATNSDGRSNGMTAPNALAQRDVITSALKLADVTPDSVNYVETHGTGTVLGDPIEFESLAATYGLGKGQGESPCALGSVKTNIGHLEAAAGVAGFIKAVLAVQRGHIPRNLHFTRWNPAIDASATRLFVPTESAPWPAAAGPRRAAVSSFGLSGTNAHVVVEQAPDTAVAAAGGMPYVSALNVSGKTAARVASAAAVLADWMSGPGAAAPLADVAHTLNRHRARHAKFATVIARDRAEAIAGLRALAAGQPRVGVVDCDQHAGGPGRVFVYSGQGSQWASMGQQLLANEPAFAKAVAELDPIFVDQVGFSLQQTLIDGDEVVGIDRIQPVLVGMQLALTELWRSYGVIPDAVIGHSMGEVSAAVVAGALTPEQGLRVITTRSRLMARLSGQGAMALLELDADAAEALIAGYPQVTLAVHASPRQTVIAGPPEQVDTVIAAVATQNRLARRVEVDVASHHPIIDPILPELRSALADLTPQPPSIPIISTTYESAQPVADADYWSANLRNPVRFHQAVTAAGVDHNTFIEISPHPVLTHALTDTLDPDGSHTVMSTMNRELDQTLYFHAQLAAVGVAASEHTTGRLVDLPPTPWHHQRFWVTDRSAMSELAATHPLLGAHIEMPRNGDHVWQTDVGTEVCPWLADHKVFGQPIMPAAGFAEIALAAASEALGTAADAVAPNIVINQFEVEQMLPLDGHTPLTTQLIRGGDSQIRVEIYSRTRGGEFCRHATAKVEQSPRECAHAHPEAQGPATGTTVSPADFLCPAPPNRPTPWSGVRGLKPDRAPGRWFRGNRDQHSRRGAAPSRVSAAPRGIGCGIAKRGCRDTRRRDRGVGGSQLSASVVRDHPGVPRHRSARQVSCPPDKPRRRHRKDGQDRPNQRRRPHSGRSGRHLSASCRTPCGTPATRAEDLRCRMDRKPDRSRAGSGASCRDDAGKLAGTRRCNGGCARQGPGQVDGRRLRAAVALADAAGAHRRYPRRIGGAGRICRNGRRSRAPAGWRGGVRRRCLESTGRRAGGGARHGVVDHHGGSCGRRHVARPITAAMAGHRGRTFRCRRRAGNTRGGFLERAGAGARLRAPGHAHHPGRSGHHTRPADRAERGTAECREWVAP